MATETVLTDDLDGTEAAETVEFSLDGDHYEVDLSEDNAEKLRKVLAKYVEKARPVKTKTASKRRPRSTSGGTASSNGTGTGTPSEAATIREWAKANGHEVSERGRISAEVREAYTAAQK